MSCIRLVSFFAITLLCLQTLASAHFTLTYPSSRGFDESNESTAPCGGYNTPSSQRVQMPLNSSFIEINSGHTSYSYVINVLAQNNPTVADFSNSSNLVKVAQGSRSYPQAACLPLAFKDIKANTNVTIQILYNGGDGSLYQCVDAILVDSAPTFNSSMCVNADGSSTSTASSSAATASSTSSQGSSIKIAFGLTFVFAVSISVLLV